MKTSSMRTAANRCPQAASGRPRASTGSPGWEGPVGGGG